MYPVLSVCAGWPQRVLGHRTPKEPQVVHPNPTGSLTRIYGPEVEGVSLLTVVYRVPGPFVSERVRPSGFPVVQWGLRDQFWS